MVTYDDTRTPELLWYHMSQSTVQVSESSVQYVDVEVVYRLQPTDSAEYAACWHQCRFFGRMHHTSLVCDDLPVRRKDLYIAQK